VLNTKVALERKSKRVTELEEELKETITQKDADIRRAQEGLRLLSNDKPSARALLELQEQLDEKTAECLKQESRVERKRQQLQRVCTLLWCFFVATFLVGIGLGV
jgi:type II secretory pathway component PulJ